MTQTNETIAIDAAVTKLEAARQQLRAIVRDIAGKTKINYALFNAALDAVEQNACAVQVEFTKVRPMGDFLDEVEILTRVPDRRHGGPYDRGGADAYYQRPRAPHYFVGATEATKPIPESAMTAEQIADYNAGYDGNEAGTKDWG